MDEYRRKLIMSYLFLQTSQEDLIDQIINLGMTGVYKHIGDTFLDEDRYVFDVVQFRGTEDFNLNLLLDVYDEMEYSMDLILSENDITDDEVEEVWIEWMGILDSEEEEDVLEDFEDFDDEDDLDFEDFGDFETWN